MNLLSVNKKLFLEWFSISCLGFYSFWQSSNQSKNDHYDVKRCVYKFDCVI